VAFEADLAALAADPGRMDEITGRRAPLAVADGSAALDLVRARGRQWTVDPDRVGILGFSAGGFVATRTALGAEPDSRPAFVGAVYGAPWGGPLPAPGAPPLFTAWAGDDELGATVTQACPANAAAWRAVGAPVEAHELADGGHGFGIERHGTASDAWFELFVTWLGGLGSASGAAG
jgi:acetyl esterase/lipase